MRERIALSAPALVAVVLLAGGCSPSAASNPDVLPSPSFTVNVSVNGKQACDAVRQATDRYNGPMTDATDSARPGIAQAWAAAIGRAAQSVEDQSLQAALLSLADQVRGWASRAPSKVALNGYRNDLTVACRPYTAS